MSERVAEEERVLSSDGSELDAALGAWGSSSGDCADVLGGADLGRATGLGEALREHEQVDVLVGELDRLRDLVAGLQMVLDRLACRSERRPWLAGQVPAQQLGKAWVNGKQVELSVADYGLLVGQIGACALAVSFHEGRAWAGDSELHWLRRGGIQLRLLARLAQTPARFVDCATLHAAAWPALVSGEQTASRDERTAAAKVAVQICRLRARLRAAGTGLQIETGPEGYMLSAPGDCLVLGESSCEEAN